MQQTAPEVFAVLFERDLTKLETEIKNYPDDASLWKLSGNIANPAGNLCLHLCGNLQNYIGAILGKSGYKRDRPFEFAARGLSKDYLLKELAATREVVVKTLMQMQPTELDETYPEETLGYPMTTFYFLTHLVGHFGYHLGQINYHRRIICANTVDIK